jgi:hypothetical protein
VLHETRPIHWPADLKIVPVRTRLKESGKRGAYQRLGRGGASAQTETEEM